MRWQSGIYHGNMKMPLMLGLVFSVIVFSQMLFARPFNDNNYGEARTNMVDGYAFTTDDANLAHRREKQLGFQKQRNQTKDIARNESALAHVHKNTAGYSHLRREGCRNRCQNGGRCILNSFCTCTNEFTGRFCDVPVSTLQCETSVGRLRHREVYFDFGGDCQLCQCFNGHFTCDNSYTCDDLRSLPISSQSEVKCTPLLLFVLAIGTIIVSTTVFRFT